MDYIVETAKPDLIVCSGDNILTTGINGLKEFVEKMDSYKIPWTFIYGNHDAESSSKNYKKADLYKYLDECDSDYLLYESGYVEATSENRYGNYTVSVLDSEGRICYAVSLPPNGYGGPMGIGDYCNSFYSDYLQKSALEILEGYGP
jgi:predicted MPP superfamily phosphohydrolase